MKQINLRDLYPDVYKEDTFVEVSDEIQAVFQSAQRAEAAYNRQRYRYKAHYSLERGDGIEHKSLARPLTPEMILEDNFLKEQVYAAVMSLPDLQAKRIYARYYLGMTITEIARTEGVSKSRITESIQRGLKSLAGNLKKILG